MVGADPLERALESEIRQTQVAAEQTRLLQLALASVGAHWRTHGPFFLTAGSQDSLLVCGTRSSISEYLRTPVERFPHLTISAVLAGSDIVASTYPLERPMPDMDTTSHLWYEELPLVDGHGYTGLRGLVEIWRNP